jgi:hypothetical protein
MMGSLFGPNDPNLQDTPSSPPPPDLMDKSMLAVRQRQRQRLLSLYGLQAMGLTGAQGASGSPTLATRPTLGGTV